MVPCSEHVADQPDGVTCTTMRREHFGQYLAGSRSRAAVQDGCVPPSSGRPHRSQKAAVELWSSSDTSVT